MGSALAYARRRTDEASARDAAAETFTIVWRRWAELEQPDLPRLYRTAALVLKNQERAGRRQQRIADKLAAQPEQVTTDAIMTLMLIRLTPLDLRRVRSSGRHGTEFSTPSCASPVGPQYRALAPFRGRRMAHPCHALVP